MEAHVATETYLSVVVPAFNEERRIAESLTRVLVFLKTQPYDWELVVVDDGSSDRTSAATAATASEAGVAVTLLRNQANRGKGYSVKRGVLAATGRYIFFTDADLSTPVEELANCLPLLEAADVVIGSRALPGSNIAVHQPAPREAMGRLFNKFAQLATVPGIKDTQCGFKGFTRKAAQDVFSRQRLNGFGFDVEILYIARKLGLKVAEVPITWADSVSSRVSPIRDGIGMFGDLLRVRLNDLKGLYD